MARHARLLAAPALLTALALLGAGALPAAQEDVADGADAHGSGADGDQEGPRDEAVRRSHTLQVGGAELAYTSVAGRLVLREENGDARASVFYVAYEQPGDELRPLTFCFNGGPGSSSVWLHLGVFGPRRVRMDVEGFPLPPPGQLVPNAHTLLRQSDLVFIDPVTTGYSRAAEERDASEFHGVDGDVEAVGEFIRLYLTRTKRWGAPLFLAGESYGTTRAAALASHLQGRHGIYLRGIVLVSSILNFQTARFDTGNDLPYALFLPTYAATAWYHGRLPEPHKSQALAPFLDEVREFARTRYTLALMRGDELPDDERDAVAARLAAYTGLTPGYVRDTNLRIKIGRFVKELLRDQRRTTGRLDSRFTGIDRDAAGERYEYDPSYAAIQGPYTSALNAYVRDELGYESDLPYEILTGRVRPWDYGEAENRYLDVAEDLRGAMTRNRALRVFVANGYYDLATPFFATEYTFAHLELDPELRANVSMGYYESGHMMYIRLRSLERLAADLERFYADALGAPSQAAEAGAGK